MSGTERKNKKSDLQVTKTKRRNDKNCMTEERQRQRQR